jgi:hypothetical protein
VKTRRWCCRCIERWSACVLALGIFGMVGFVASLAAVAAGWVGTSGFCGFVCVSLSSYSVSLLVGHLGDSFEHDAWAEPASPRRERSRAAGMWAS